MSAIDLFQNMNMFTAVCVFTLQLYLPRNYRYFARSAIERFELI